MESTLRKLTLVGIISAAFVVFGCSDRSQELEERVADLKKKIDQLQAQLDAAKQGNAQERPASEPDPSGGLPTKAALESTYEVSSKELRDEIAAKLTEFSIENYTTHSVQMPENLFPFTSKLSFSLHSNDGKAYQMDLPVKADYTGKWVFPSVDDIVKRINSAKDTTPISEKEAATNAASPRREATQDRPPIMNVDGTIVIEWGDSQKPKDSPSETSDVTSTHSLSPPSEPSTAATGTQAPSVLKPPVMPVNRDVHIKFPSPPK